VQDDERFCADAECERVDEPSARDRDRNKEARPRQLVDELP
jgi:hypothetical protein